jgi:hypothetical protein
MESNNIELLPTQYKLKNKPEQVESQKHRQECTNNFTKKCPKNVCLLHPCRHSCLLTGIPLVPHSSCSPALFPINPVIHKAFVLLFLRHTFGTLPFI